MFLLFTGMYLPITFGKARNRLNMMFVISLHFPIIKLKLISILLLSVFSATEHSSHIVKVGVEGT